MFTILWKRGGLGFWLIAVLLGSNVWAGPCPRITHTKTGYRLLIPSSFEKALQVADPGFTPWKLPDYSPDIQKEYCMTSRQAPWAVIGDFNGDGWCDLVIDGQDSTTCSRFCVWGGEGGARAMKLASRPRPKTPELAGSALQFMAPGEIGTNFSDESLSVFTDSFNDYIWGKAGALFYWKNDHFEEFVTSD